MESENALSPSTVDTPAEAPRSRSVPTAPDTKKWGTDLPRVKICTTPPIASEP